MQLGIVDCGSSQFLIEKLLVAPKQALSIHMANLVPIYLQELQPVPAKQWGTTSFHNYQPQLVGLCAILYRHGQLSQDWQSILGVGHNIGLAELDIMETCLHMCSEMRETTAPVSTSIVIGCLSMNTSQLWPWMRSYKW